MHRQRLVIEYVLEDAFGCPERRDPSIAPPTPQLGMCPKVYPKDFFGLHNIYLTLKLSFIVLKVRGDPNIHWEELDQIGAVLTVGQPKEWEGMRTLTAA